MTTSNVILSDRANAIDQLKPNRLTQSILPTPISLRSWLMLVGEGFNMKTLIVNTTLLTITTALLFSCFWLIGGTQ
jgi:hypothetical protein